MSDPKERSDAWGADLPENVRWDVYDLAKSLPWPKEVADQLEALGIVRLPSRAAWYRFLARMRRADAERRIERLAASVAEAQTVADKHGIQAAVMVETLKTLAIDKAMTGDGDGAAKLAAAAAGIWDRAQREKELELKTARQRTADEQLRLAREKFEAAEKRLAAATDTVSDERLTDAERVSKIRELFGLK